MNQNILKSYLTTICISILVFIQLETDAQNQRLLILEHFTQASCGPCATADPALEVLLAQNTTKVTSIKYHMSWPGTDPMHNHNPNDADGRRNSYGINSIPRSHLDGNVFADHPGSLTQTHIDNRYATTTPVNISLTSSINSGVLQANVTVSTSQVLSGNYSLHIAVVEEHVGFTSAPGTNGLTDFYNVMKAMLPNYTGTSFTSLTTLSPLNSIQSWTLSNVYDINELRVIAFVQNNSTDEILQGAIHNPTYTAPFNLDAELVEVNIPDAVCGSSLTPEIAIRNAGNNALNSLTISYSVNGGPAVNYQWTGNLLVNQSTTLQLPQSTGLVLGTNNTIVVGLSNPNGSVDQNSSNDQLVETFGGSFSTSSTNVYLALTTDDYCEETTWEMRNAGGIVLYSGGPYTQNTQDNTLFNYTFNLTNAGCYEFIIYDAYGDGICCSYGNGSYVLTDGNGTQIFAGGVFTLEESTPIEIDPVTCHAVTVLTTDPITPTSARFDWDAVSGAHHYLVRGRRVGLSTWTFLTIPNGAPTHKDVFGLTNGMSYEWEVQAICDATGTDVSAWSQTQTFTTACQVPASTWVNPILSTGAQINWDAVNGAAGYEIKGKRVGTTLWHTIMAGTGVTNRQVFGLNPGLTYEYTIRAWCDQNGNKVSDWHSLTQFTTASANRQAAISTQSEFSAFAVTTNPNPFSDFTTLQFSSVPATGLIVSVYDLTGIMVQQHKVLHSTQFEISAEHLERGIYFYQVESEQVSIANGKLVVN